MMPQSLNSLQVEADVLVVAVQSQILQLHDGLFGHLISLEGLVGELTAGHIVRELGIVQIGNVAGGDQLAGTDDGKALLYRSSSWLA